MTNETILKKAIEKVRKKGFKKYHSDFVDTWSEADIREMLFDHHFAKAFWGEQNTAPFSKFNSNKQYAPAWQCHLQQMVLEEEPLKYIEEFL